MCCGCAALIFRFVFTKLAISIGIHIRPTDKSTELASFFFFFFSYSLRTSSLHTIVSYTAPKVHFDKTMAFEYFCCWKHNVLDAVRIVFAQFNSCGSIQIYIYLWFPSCEIRLACMYTMVTFRYLVIASYSKFACLNYVCEFMAFSIQRTFILNRK